MGCLGILGLFAATIALGVVIETVDPEGAKRRAAEAEVARKASAAEDEAEAKALAAAEQRKVDAEREAAEAKRRSGFHCLSKWDGSHRELVRSLKASLRDPDSFEHIETRITPVDDKGYHVLMMNYRARNGFGGMNIGRLAAKVKGSDCSFEILANADE
jgi:hypothetical protein